MANIFHSCQVDIRTWISDFFNQKKNSTLHFNKGVINCDRKRSIRSLYIQGMKIWFFVSFCFFFLKMRSLVCSFAAAPFSGRTICSIVSSVTFSGYTHKPINQSNQSIYHSNNQSVPQYYSAVVTYNKTFSGRPIFSIVSSVTFSGCTHKPINQSINQSINRSINQSIKPI